MCTWILRLTACLVTKVSKQMLIFKIHWWLLTPSLELLPVRAVPCGSHFTSTRWPMFSLPALCPLSQARTGWNQTRQGLHVSPGAGWVMCCDASPQASVQGSQSSLPLWGELRENAGLTSLWTELRGVKQPGKEAWFSYSGFFSVRIGLASLDSDSEMKTWTVLWWAVNSISETEPDHWSENHRVISQWLNSNRDRILTGEGNTFRCWMAEGLAETRKQRKGQESPQLEEHHCQGLHHCGGPWNLLSQPGPGREGKGGFSHEAGMTDENCPRQATLPVSCTGGSPGTRISANGEWKPPGSRDKDSSLSDEMHSGGSVAGQGETGRVWTAAWGNLERDSNKWPKKSLRLDCLWGSTVWGDPTLVLWPCPVNNTVILIYFWAVIYKVSEGKLTQ